MLIMNCVSVMYNTGRERVCKDCSDVHSSPKSHCLLHILLKLLKKFENSLEILIALLAQNIWIILTSKILHFKQHCLISPKKNIH
ncbi:hypothetical protein FKM82_001218 [Ascaphus truei]